MFSNALFVTFSHPHTAAALRTVVGLMRRDGGHTTAMAIVSPTPAWQRLLTPGSTLREIESVLVEEVRADLDEWVERATGEKHPVDVDTVVDIGHPVASVLQRVLEEDHDLLAVTGHPEDPIARAIIKRLQRKSPCPVWALRPSRARRRRILAAIDTDPDHHGLDQRILAAAKWLAAEGDELHVVTAWELLGESTLRASPFINLTDDAVDELRDRCAHDHLIALEKLVAEAGLADGAAKLHVVNGEPAEVVTDLVERHDINQLVIGTIARTGIPGFVVGNTAEQLLGEVGCSELAVKPPGWATPFQL